MYGEKFKIFTHISSLDLTTHWANVNVVRELKMNTHGYTQLSPMAQGMHGGLLTSSFGVMRCKQWSWKVCPHGRTATIGAIGGTETGPSGVKARSLLHIKHLCPISWVSSSAAKEKTFYHHHIRLILDSL